MRLCVLKPGLDYKPVRNAVRRMQEFEEWEATHKHSPRDEMYFGYSVPRGIQIPPIDAEMTVTRYEALSDDVRGLLSLMNVDLEYLLSVRAWQIKMTVRGKPLQVFLDQGANDEDWKYFLGHVLDEGYAPTQPLRNIHEKIACGKKDHSG